MIGKRRMTSTVFAERVGGQKTLTPQQVHNDPQARTQAQIDAVIEVSTFMADNRVVLTGDLTVEWKCQVSAYGYRCPEGMDYGVFTALVAAHREIDHFGGPAAMTVDHYIEEPHREH